MGWSPVKEVGKYLAKKSGGSLAGGIAKEAVKGAVGGLFQAAGEAYSAVKDADTRKYVATEQLKNQKLIEHHRLDQQRFQTTMQALSSAKSPAQLVATIVGLATATPKKYRELSSTAIEDQNMPNDR